MAKKKASSKKKVEKKKAPAAKAPAAKAPARRAPAAKKKAPAARKEAPARKAPAAETEAPAAKSAVGAKVAAARAEARKAGPAEATGPVEVLFSFDTTGSMYPCLTQVRRDVSNMVKRLFAEISGIRIGIIAHGDYCDAGSTYVTKMLELSTNQEKIVDFVKKVSATGGGDAAECYELVLHEARSAGWAEGTRKILVLIGDEVPHKASEKQNEKKLDWQEECKKLAADGIAVYSVQALGRKHATSFYAGAARLTDGLHLQLDQFSHIGDMITAICYRQVGVARVEEFEREVTARGGMNRSLDRMFVALTGRAPSETFTNPNLASVNAARFQILTVDDNCSIKDFVAAQGLGFKVGRGFYEFTKVETIQGYKEIVLMDAKGDLYSGAKAREMIELPEGVEARVPPAKLEAYTVFVQSTSANRKLVGGTRFLYEVEDWDRVGEAVEA